MIMNMIKASEVIEIFLKYGISNSKDESKYEISELDGITNTSYVVDLDNEKYVLRIPGDNPDVINRKSEKQNTLKAQEYGLTLPYIIFDENTGVKISKYFDIYTYKSSDFKNENMRKEAFKKLFDLHNSDLVFEIIFHHSMCLAKLLMFLTQSREMQKKLVLRLLKKLKKLVLIMNLVTKTFIQVIL